MNFKPIIITLISILCISNSNAHKRWLLPSDFSLSDDETIFVDFTASNNIFYPDNPMPLKGVKAIAPDGLSLALKNPVTGKRRSSFEVDIRHPGTHRIYTVGQPVYFVSYKLPNQKKPIRARGTLKQLQADVPPLAFDIHYAQATALIETFVTRGAESEIPPIKEKPKLYIEYLNHPSSLYSDETTQVKIMLNGKAATGATLTIISEGSRYRSSLAEQHFIADTNGIVAISWSNAGRHLINVQAELPGENNIAQHHVGYFATVEVNMP